MMACVTSCTYQANHMKHLSFIHSFQLFLSMYCGYWWYWVFSLKCLPIVNLWQFRTWSKRYDGSNRETLWTCTSHLTSHLKHQLLIHTIPKVLSALKPLTCVYVLSFLPEPLLLEWTSNRRRWELLGSAGNVGLEDVSGWRRGQLMSKVMAFTRCPWVHRPGGGVLWRPGELLLRQSLSLCTLGSHHNGSPVPDAMAFPNLPLHWIHLSLECLSCHPIQPPASVVLLPDWETSPGIKPSSFHPPEATG